MKKIRFGVIGCGNIGTRHLAVIDAEPNAELVAACDIDSIKLQKIKENYDIDCYTNYKDLIKRKDIDIVCICTPHLLHSSMAIDTAKAHKHILTEKPMALTTKECKAMISAAKKNRVKLFVVKQNRYNIPIRLLKDAIDRGWLGKIYMVHCNVLWNRHLGYYKDSDWRGKKKTEGGVLYTQVSHFIDLLLWFVGDIKNAVGKTFNLKHKLEIEDTGQALLKFKSGTVGCITWTTTVHEKNYEGSILIIAENGTIKVGGKYLNVIEYWDVKNHPLPVDVEYTDKPNSYKNYQGTSSNHDRVIKDIILNLNNKKNTAVEGEEGMKTTTLIEKIYKYII